MIFGKARTKTKRLTGLGSRFSIFMATLLSLGASSLVSLGYGEMEEVSVPSSPSLPKGDNSLSKFASSLSETHGFGGKISFDASFLNNDKKTSSVLHLEEGTLSFYKDEETAFHLEGSLSYDRANLPLLLHYSDENAYLSILGARYSYKTSDFDSLFDSIISHIIKNYKLKNKNVYVSFDHMYCSTHCTVFMISVRIGKQRYSFMV